METDNDLSFRARVRLILIFEWRELALLHFVWRPLFYQLVYSVLWECVLSSRNESIYHCLCVLDLHNAAPRRIARDEGEACEGVEGKTDGTHRRAGFAIHVCA